MIRAIQLIDSLDAGGAERLAVTYANLLVSEIDGSFLCATRQEGLLKDSIGKGVKYLFLQKKSSIDLNAVIRFKKYLKTNDISIIHAHATSFFFATLTKLFYPRIKIFWHDHYGKSEELKKRPKFILQFCSLFFHQIFSVNQKLLTWASKNLFCSKVQYLPNVVMLNDLDQETNLFGEDNKRILCLANLRPQKDHLNLFKAFQLILKTYPDWTLHCVGKDFEDDYSRSIKEFVSKNSLEDSIYFYNSKPDIKHIISQCEIGVLSSKSEGLPLALLEYGLGELASVVTNVGDCGLVLSSTNLGQLVEAQDPSGLAEALTACIAKTDYRKEVGLNLKQKVEQSFSCHSIIKKLKDAYEG
ncbi:glycosyltransferase [Winogradskyella alexanderae]|uniref:Glycosyltransferase n=1 Tax=Winogradskyella alexanderae TaxID=2877123 RepID=A0ABS7XSZ4_9FLAO|nr:glycosyltransferase [Winogradskyella alexanderae]MCA0131966.1 glycosyltransferase [Winogradskyella alexanderae]